MEFFCPRCETVWFAKCVKCGSMSVSNMRCNKCGSASLNNFCPSCGCIVGGASSGSACFISTACVRAKGLPDDCDELQTLRHWRDKLCKSDEKLKLLTEDYYKNAPSIIEIIDSLENSRQVYAQVYNELVVPTVELLKSGETDAAIKHYKAYYLSLTKKYGKPNGIEIVSQSATLGRY